ncbi:MAG: AAA family ATPase [Lachnospiraceae bacterium]|nr:AAA family ATPase [Lachnospiraceae bacterium]
MRILKCHIENFGKLSNASFDFTEGCNVICENNGWGKSTLATFIKVMFYGFDGESKKKLAEKEREIYRPWQGGVYGGQLTFEVDGNIYTMLRSFGKKEADDEFVLKDEATNLSVDKFSSNVGEELFKIDSESFKRTVYISQNDCTTMATDSINAKIGNLAENTDDINNYENVDKRLKDILNAMIPTRITGSLNKIKKYITQLTEEVKEAESIDKSIEEITNRSETEKEKLNCLKKRREELANEQSKLSAAKDMQVKKEKYNTLINEYNVRLNEFEKEKSYFANGVPDETLLREIIAEASGLEALRQSVRIYEPTAEECIKYENNNREEFSNKDVIEKEISRIHSLANSRNEKKSMLSMKKMELTNRQTLIMDKKNKFDMMLLVLGVVMLVLGIATLIIADINIIGILIIVTGVVCAIAGLVIKGNRSKNYSQSDSELILQLENEIKSDEEFISESENEIKAFFEKYSILYNENDTTSQLYELRNIIKECEVIRKKISKYNEAKDRLEGEREKVCAFIRNLGFTPAENLIEQLREMQNKMQKIDLCNKEFRKALNAKEEFEKNENIQQLINIDTISVQGQTSMEELTEEFNTIHHQIENINENISLYNKTLDDYRIKRDDITDKEAELEKLKLEYAKGVKKYNLLVKTRELLNEAKTSFTAKYMQPVMTGFAKYYKMISKSNADAFCIDANINLSVNEMGMPRDISSLSTGNRDMIGVCMRMALIDAMYKEEKPFVIFDDPFVNLDKDKIDGGMEFIKEIAHEYQVIYFTCHNSRV